MRVRLLAAASVQGRLEAESLYLERQAAACPEALREPLRALAAERRAALEALTAEIDAVEVLVPDEAARFVPPEEVVREEEAPVEPIREE
jgi:hypothetical protein